MRALFLLLALASCAASPVATNQSRLAGHWFGSMLIDYTGVVYEHALTMKIAPTKPDSVLVDGVAYTIGRYELDDERVSFYLDYPEKNAMWVGDAAGPEIEGLVFVRATKMVGTFRLVRGVGRINP